MSRFEQDWDEFLIHGSSKPAVKGRTKEQTASRAMQSGATVTAVRKETHKPTSTKPGYKLDAIGTDDEPDVVQRLLQASSSSSPLFLFFFRALYHRHVCASLCVSFFFFY